MCIIYFLYIILSYCFLVYLSSSLFINQLLLKLCHFLILSNFFCYCHYLQNVQELLSNFHTQYSLYKNWQYFLDMQYNELCRKVVRALTFTQDWTKYKYWAQLSIYNLCTLYTEHTIYLLPILHIFYHYLDCYIFLLCFTWH